ncbi:uncharacterized protein LACBIDRAFT_315100 [Laccaria bicolor S238N-H82]|uniref:Predicted protein n=1 Tax=Laccaria bicolor (strain S238N-H82 / ATCC MYA-4686) TaxID=486041 RepID=B0DZT6_LACBS|nr:uncharacterized protein LACBIDRAFT_315100 [Laccaria bicolor S238N-H82]EDQ99889.1 predicted protein [Laccaria bicolor S238N-H82]|eukprot:XP_001889432.1 predicted protein [Laccaria bicolor S238N-H82]
MFRKNRNRQEYSPLHDPIDPGDGSLDWYYGDHAGGMVFDFGKHKGRQLHAICLDYIAWWYTTRTASGRSHPTLSAIEVYVDGLREYAKENYLDFVVPFGQKHGGQTIGECRDKKWMAWSCRKQDLIDKYPIYFLAVDYHLQNPRHYNQTRDIGELLSASRYADDIDLQHEEEQDESDLSDIVVPDGHVEYESDAESDSDSDDGCKEGMKVTSPKGKKPKKARSLAAMSKGKSSPKTPSKKTPKNIMSRAQATVTRHMNHRLQRQNHNGESLPTMAPLKNCQKRLTRNYSIVSHRNMEGCTNLIPFFDRDSFDDFLVDDSSYDGDASFQPSGTEIDPRGNSPSEPLGAETDSEPASTISSIVLTQVDKLHQNRTGTSLQAKAIPHHLQRNPVKCNGNQTIELLPAVTCRFQNPPMSNHVAQQWLLNPKTNHLRRRDLGSGEVLSCSIALPRHLTVTPVTQQRKVTPPSEFDGVEAEARSEDDHEETDPEVASTVRTTPELDSNKSASEDDSGYATPTPKGRLTKQSRKMQRHSKNRDVFDGDVRIPASPSKQRRPKVVVDSEDEPPPTARHRKRQVTPFSDSDVVEEADSVSEGSNESDEGDFWDNVQSPDPRVPITPHRKVVSDDEDAVTRIESTCTESDREKPFVFSKVQTHIVPNRTRSANRRKREGGICAAWISFSFALLIVHSQLHRNIDCAI